MIFFQKGSWVNMESGFRLWNEISPKTFASSRWRAVFFIWMLRMFLVELKKDRLCWSTEKAYGTFQNLSFQRLDELNLGIRIVVVATVQKILPVKQSPSKISNLWKADHISPHFFFNKFNSGGSWNHRNLCLKPPKAGKRLSSRLKQKDHTANKASLLERVL